MTPFGGLQDISSFSDFGPSSTPPGAFGSALPSHASHMFPSTSQASSSIDSYDLTTLLQNRHVKQLFTSVHDLQGQLRDAQTQLQTATAQVTQLSEVSRIQAEMLKENSRLLNLVIQNQTDGRTAIMDKFRPG
jgi:vacuolar-type H+-ATPase subunit I/STV1